MKNLILISALAMGLMACSSPRTSTVTDDQSGTVVFKVVPSSSEIFVDGQQIGHAYDYSGSAKVLKLQPGKHAIVVKNGEKACRQDVYLSDTQEIISCNLE